MAFDYDSPAEFFIPKRRGIGRVGRNAELSRFTRRAFAVLDVLLAAFGGGGLTYYIVGVMLGRDLWRDGLLMASFDLIPLVLGFILASRA